MTVSFPRRGDEVWCGQVFTLRSRLGELWGLHRITQSEERWEDPWHRLLWRNWGRVRQDPA